MRISREARERLSPNAQGDRIFRAEDDGDQSFCALLRRNAGESSARRQNGQRRGSKHWLTGVEGGKGIA